MFLEILFHYSSPPVVSSALVKLLPLNREIEILLWEPRIGVKQPLQGNFYAVVSTKSTVIIISSR